MPGPHLDLAFDWFRKMIEIRLFEEKVQELFMQGRIGGSTHLCQGQEAVSVGCVAALTSGDVLTNTYRGHGEALARGMSPEAAFRELMGREGGCCGGVGGSMHLTDFASGNVGANAIVGAGIPIAVGCATAFQIRDEAHVAMTFFGDGATNIGSFHEALNLAAVWRAPIVFVVVNNLYAEYSPLRETTAVDDLAVRAMSYGMPGVIVDGQDIDVVFQETIQAVVRARSGEGPTLLEMKTYRYRGHSRSDPGKYRPTTEVEAWKKRDPIEILGTRLNDAGLLTRDDQAALHAEVQALVDAAAASAVEAPTPTREEIQGYVYAS